MSPAEAIRQFEQKLVSARAIAACDRAFTLYKIDMLPPMSESHEALIHQGFEAGFDAAMDSVRGILIGIQNEVLREAT